ncbi:MAG: hypothetical protein SGCHY_000196 [Lobulomycetales sp.]
MAPIIMTLRGSFKVLPAPLIYPAQMLEHLEDGAQLEAAWKVCTKAKSVLENGKRLENVSWRLWYHSQTVGFKPLSHSTTSRLENDTAISSRQTPSPEPFSGETWVCKRIPEFSEIANDSALALASPPEEIKSMEDLLQGPKGDLLLETPANYDIVEKVALAKDLSAGTSNVSTEKDLSARHSNVLTERDQPTSNSNVSTKKHQPSSTTGTDTTTGSDKAIVKPIDPPANPTIVDETPDATPLDLDLGNIFEVPPAVTFSVSDFSPEFGCDDELENMNAYLQLDSSGCFNAGSSSCPDHSLSPSDDSTCCASLVQSAPVVEKQKQSFEDVLSELREGAAESASKFSSQFDILDMLSPMNQAHHHNYHRPTEMRNATSSYEYRHNMQQSVIPTFHAYGLGGNGSVHGYPVSSPLVSQRQVPPSHQQQQQHYIRWSGWTAAADMLNAPGLTRPSASAAAPNSPTIEGFPSPFPDVPSHNEPVESGDQQSIYVPSAPPSMIKYSKQGARLVPSATAPVAKSRATGGTCCYNCEVTSTPLWRRTPDDRLVCNACGLYFKLHGTHRPKPKPGPATAAYAAAPDDSGREVKCDNCSTTNTPLWRRIDDALLCNACGLYLRLHRTSRPVGLRKETVRKRLRKAEIVGKSSGGGKRLKS